MTQYQVTPIWWPDGWEPLGPWDVPNCVARVPDVSSSPPEASLDRALATVRGLNRQNMDHPGTVWYVVTEADGPTAVPPAEQSAALKIVRPPEGSTGGDCSHCPASKFPCAAEK